MNKTTLLAASLVLAACSPSMTQQSNPNHHSGIEAGQGNPLKPHVNPETFSSEKPSTGSPSARPATGTDIPQDASIGSRLTKRTLEDLDAVISQIGNKGNIQIDLYFDKAFDVNIAGSTGDFTLKINDVSFRDVAISIIPYDPSKTNLSEAERASARQSSPDDLPPRINWFSIATTSGRPADVKELASNLYRLNPVGFYIAMRT